MFHLILIMQGKFTFFSLYFFVYLISLMKNCQDHLDWHNYLFLKRNLIYYHFIIYYILLNYQLYF